jgi:undecaprenyl-diphosphatase
MNLALFRWINSLAGKNPFLDALMLFLSKDMIFLVALFLVLLYVFGFVDHRICERKLAVNAAVFALMNLGLAALCGVFFYVPRPFIHHKVNQLYPHAADSSFPSDHSTATMSAALGILKGRRKLGLLLIFVSLAAGFSRVYVGHHTPADVIGTYLAVIISSVLYNTFIRGLIDRAYERVETAIGGRLKAAGRSSR